MVEFSDLLNCFAITTMIILTFSLICLQTHTQTKNDQLGGVKNPQARQS